MDEATVTPVAVLADDFFIDFDVVRKHFDDAVYQDVVNPVDGVTYPGITMLPAWMIVEVLQGVRKMMGWSPICRTIFARLSLAGTKAPHQAHTDNSMGQYSLMLYLNRPEDCCGGTALLQHWNGMERAPTEQADVDLAMRDTNIHSAWSPMLDVAMKTNRAFIFAADLFHRAEPVGGFGSTPQDGRLVLTMFFDKGRA